MTAVSESGASRTLLNRDVPRSEEQGIVTNLLVMSTRDLSLHVSFSISISTPIF